MPVMHQGPNSPTSRQERALRLRKVLRRSLLSGGAGVIGTGALVHRAAPGFWQQVSKEIGRPVLPPAHRPHPASWPDQGLHAAWLGHSTVLVKADGFFFLTDPVFSTRVGLNLGPVTVGLKRLMDPATGLHELPVPQLILLSHAHMDHFDVPSLKALENKHTSIVTAASTSDLLRLKRYQAVHELKWGESRRVGPALVTAFQVNHWGARMRSDSYRGYNGYVVEVGRYRILFGGDTAYTDSFKQLKSSREFDLAIMPVGAYDPWIRVHCNPEQAWTMANHAGSEFVMPVHHQTFQLSREPFHEPIERILEAAGNRPDRICVREIGQEVHLA
jgi:L-ascorbate metabolism protein UlaG (beta-lactamase superfamily)